MVADDQNRQIDPVAGATSKTIADFGEQWVNYRDNPGYYGSVALLADICGPLLAVEDLMGARVADIGSGTGRIVNMLLDGGAEHVVAVEPSAAFSVLRENTADRQNSITYINNRGESLPPYADIDIVVSMGVIHHIPDPAPVLAAAYRALKPGGRMLVWLYGFEGNETYLRFIEPLRSITKRLPHRILQGICALLNLVLDVYIFLCRFLPMPMRKYMRNVLARLPRGIRSLVIYDQLNPAYAKYYRREEAEALLQHAGFENVHVYHRHGYSWTVIGNKPFM